MKPLLSLENSRRKLHEKTGHSKDRFISIDIGPIVGHPIILKCISRSNRESEGVLGSDFEGSI